MKFWSLFIIICFSPICLGQLIVASGTTLSIDSNTSIRTGNVYDTIRVENGAQITNNGIIELDSLGYIDDINSPIVGSGYEHFRKIYHAPISNINLGGMGFSVSTNVADTFDIARYHSNFSINGNNSIDRHYVFNAYPSVSSLNCSFDTDLTEMNGNLGNDLVMASSYDGGNNWLYTLGITNAVDYSLSGLLVDSLGLHTLIDFSTIASANDKDRRQVNVYPNPVLAGESLKVSTINFEGETYVDLIDMEGQLIKNFYQNESSNTFALDANLKKGQYLMILSNREWRIIKKIVVQ